MTMVDVVSKQPTGGPMAQVKSVGLVFGTVLHSSRELGTLAMTES